MGNIKEWIYREQVNPNNPLEPIKVIKCPYCSLMINREFLNKIDITLVNYCMNCGAKLNYYKSYERGR